MDENNLDSLLDELSSMDGELNENIDIDSGVDVDADDMDDISLDELDHLDGMDLGDLDFDDIDFDDVDITKLDAGANPVVKKKPQEQETDDMSLDALIEKANQENVKPEPPQEEPSVQADNTDVFGEADLQMQEDTALPEGVFDDALFGSMDMGMSEEPELSEKEKNPYTADEDSLDALLQSSMAESLLNGDLADIEDIGEKTEEPVKKVKQPRKKAEKKKAEIEEEETEHKKKTISEILFGEPDEDDLEEEALFEEKKAKKEAEKKKKQAEREAKKEEKDAAKQEMLTAKQAKDKAKQKEKADKKRQKDEAYAAELEAEKDQKKVSTPTVIVVFVLFFALAAGVVLGTNYFERQRYRLAYDEVSGVEVKEKDQDLKDRIYTVMYVERLYESYENNMKLGRADKALDALLRGIQKYDEHYDEAVELDIVKDIDSCRDKIINALWNTYGITEETAYQILAMEGQEYTKTLSELGAKAAETETPTDAQGQ